MTAGPTALPCAALLLDVDGTLIDSTPLVEDAPAGIAAGRAAGATVVAVTTSHPRESLTGARHVVEDLTALAPAPGGLTLG